MTCYEDHRVTEERAAVECERFLCKGIEVFLGQFSHAFFILGVLEVKQLVD